MEKMIRKLTDEERKATKKGIKHRLDRIKDYTMELAYLKDARDLYIKHAEYLKRQDEIKKKKENDVVKQTLKYLEDSIKHEKDALKTERGHLKDGVEIKEVIGVA